MMDEGTHDNHTRGELGALVIVLYGVVITFIALMVLLYWLVVHCGRPAQLATALLVEGL